MSSPAVLWRGCMGEVDGGRFRLPENTLPAIASTAVKLGAGVVYALDDGQALAGGQGWAEPIVTGGVAGAKRPPWRVQMATMGEGAARARTVTIVWPAHDTELSAGPWQGHDALELLDAFAELERQRVPWSHSLAATVHRLILDTHPLKRGGRKLDDAPMPEPARSPTLEMPYMWRRDFSREEAASAWVHVFDLNAQYLSAWGTSELGHGIPHRMVRPRFDKSRAGVWRLEHAPVVPPSLLPAPWGPSGLRTPDGATGAWWVTTPTLQRILEVCEGLDVPLVLDAWVWPERSRYLRGAAERLRDVRASLRDTIAAAAEIERTGADLEAVAAAIRRRAIAQSALEAVGALYKRGTQQFNSEPAEGDTSAWYRPDWSNTIRAQARVNLHRKLEELGRAPFAIDVDALVYATDVADAGEFAELARIRLGPGLGQFKHEASGPMRPEYAELSPGQIVKSLKEVA